MDALQRQLKLRARGKRCSYADRTPRAQQRVTRKKKGAHNWRKAIQKVAQNIPDEHRDFFKVYSQLISFNDN